MLAMSCSKSKQEEVIIMPFEAQHLTRTQNIHLSASPDRVFPLFDPIGEKQWADGWEPEIMYPLSGEVEEGMVFTIGSHDEVQVIWTILAFDAAKWEISYLRVTPGSHVAIIDIRCEDNLNETTRASISYTFTALTEQGNDYVTRFTGPHYQEWMSMWEKAINYSLQHGHPLQHH
jgi:hypothetical protein